MYKRNFFYILVLTLLLIGYSQLIYQFLFIFLLGLCTITKTWYLTCAMPEMGLYKTKSKHYIDTYYQITIINIFILSLITSSSMASSSSPVDFSTAILIRVDQSGKGDFNKIQEAIDSIPPNLNNSQLYFIWVKPGVYRYKNIFLCI